MVPQDLTAKPKTGQGARNQRIKNKKSSNNSLTMLGNGNGAENSTRIENLQIRTEMGPNMQHLHAVSSMFIGKYGMNASNIHAGSSEERTSSPSKLPPGSYRALQSTKSEMPAKKIDLSMYERKLKSLKSQYGGAA